MNDFELPIIRKTQNQKRILSMDEYLQFVQFNLQNMFDKKGYEEWKKMLAVDFPFSID